MKKYDELDFVIVWSSIKELADSTAARPGQAITTENLNKFANKVLEAFPVEFTDYMKILELGIEKEYESADNEPSDTL